MVKVLNKCLLILTIIILVSAWGIEVTSLCQSYK